ncbi:MAG: YdcF family protein [Marinoscillum sp.]|uniref:YdcF family protein n=3 Tax=Marinoscillum sp. TaxID=2024838 RepID=UPI0032F25B43
MFFIASKVLFFLISPLSWIITLLIFAVFSRKDKLKKYALWASCLLLLIFTNPMLSNYAMVQWEYAATPKDQLPYVETAVVLGGMLETGKEPTDQYHFNGSADRINEALLLYKEGIVQRLILSGGSGSLMDQTLREAHFLGTYSQTLTGAYSQEIILEANSRNTYENAIETARILDSLDLKEQKVLLITSASHMARALRCFKKQGILVIPFAVDFRGQQGDWNPFWILPSYASLEDWNILIKEWVGLLTYRLTGYI